jgi:alpha-beta hydrolase superfamily lysophospholipase
MKAWRVAAAALLAAGCVSFPDAPGKLRAPAIEGDALVASDGTRLPLRLSAPDDAAVVVVALHGMNDYRNAWATPSENWGERGIAVLAYDQRGFGANADSGRWPGSAALRSDLRDAIAAARARFPGAPVFAVGHSLGAAVVLSAMGEAPLDVDGVILAAPGVWGGSQLPIAYRATANIAASFAPGKTLTGERTDRQASDNIAVLRALYEDPLVIKATRLDAILGAVRLMGEAYDASDEAGGAVLLQFGAHDEIIPPRSMKRAGDRLCGDVVIKSYDANWHLLYRDLEGATPLLEAADWMLAKARDEPQAGVIRAGPAALSCAVRH